MSVNAQQEFQKKYGLKPEKVFPVDALSGFDFDSVYKKRENLFTAIDVKNHKFLPEEDFKGKILLSLFVLPSDRIIDTPQFTRDAKAAGYFFPGMKGLILAYENTRYMFVPKIGVIIPHREVKDDDRHHADATDVPMLYFDGMIRYSTTSVTLLPCRKPPKPPVGILLGNWPNVT